MTSLKAAGIGVVVLAAGAARRMRGAAKQLASFEDKTFLRRATETALESQASQVVVVLGAYFAETSAEIEDLPVIAAHNEIYEKGLSSSVVCGLKTLLAANENLRAVVITLADQPFVTAENIDSLIAAFERAGSPLAAAAYNSTVGVPALFSRELFTELLQIEGDKGAKELIARHRGSAVVVSLPEAAIDIDTPEDFARLSG